MIESAWVDVSLTAPWQFQEDITPVADTLEYALLQNYWDTPQDDVELYSVEIWDSSTTPNKPLRHIEPAAAHAAGLAYSQAGWRVWNGKLILPYRWEQFIDPDSHLIRVWGYAPWPFPGSSGDTLPFSLMLEKAVLTRCYMEALRRLINNRALFKQWQTRSNNTDISVPMLMNDLAQARDEWKAMADKIRVLREAP